MLLPEEIPGREMSEFVLLNEHVTLGPFPAARSPNHKTYLRSRHPERLLEREHFGGEAGTVVYRDFASQFRDPTEFQLIGGNFRD